MLRKRLLLFFLFITTITNAQLTDLARLEYSFIPKSQSEDQYTRLRFLFNYPVELKNDAYLVFGAAYNRIILNLDEEKYQQQFNVELLNTVSVVDFSVGYTFKMNKDWRVAFKVTPRLASTLTERITKDDFFINGGVFFIKDRSEAKNITPYRLILGLTYNTTVGVPVPLPLVSYTRFVNEKWSYMIGVPKMNIKHRFNNKHSMQTYLGLDGYFAHVQQPSMLNTGENIESVSLSVAVVGLGYEYSFTKNLVAYSYIGHTLRLNNRLRDEDREDVFQLDNANSFYLRTGLKFKI